MLSVPLSHLIRMLYATRKFTDDDYGLPACEVVRLEGRAGVFTATATDRFALAHARCDSAEGVLPTTYIRRTEVRRLLKVLRALHYGGRSGVIATLGKDTMVTLRQTDAKNLLIKVGEMTLNAVGSHFEKWLDVDKVANPRPETVRHQYVLSPTQLDRIIRLVDKLALMDPDPLRAKTPLPLRITGNGKKKPVRVEVGNWLVILQMPVSLKPTEFAGTVTFGLPPERPAEQPAEQAPPADPTPETAA